MSITSSPSSSSITLKFTRRFLRSLMEIKRREYHNNNNNNNMCSSRGIRKRIKLAAYASMARAVGPRKAWARAVLRKKRHSFVVGKRQRFSVKKNKDKKKRKVNNNMAEKLRETIPGGKDMDLCSLFEETAHFIHCLSLQVQIMQLIANRFSN